MNPSPGTLPTPHLDAVLATNEGVWVRLGLVDVAGDVLAGLLLSQIAYWTPRATVERQGAFWIVKAHGEWWDEVRLTEKQARRALQVLVDGGLVETHVWKWNGTPKLHVRIVAEALEAGLARLAQEGKSTCPQGREDPPPRSTPVAQEGKSSLHTETTIRDHSETVVVSDDARRLCELLADLMAERGCKRPTVTKRWLDEADRLYRLDGRDPAKAERLLRWSQADSFWKANIQSIPKFREKYDQLRDNANRGRSSTEGNAEVARAWAEDRRAG